MERMSTIWDPSGTILAHFGHLMAPLRHHLRPLGHQFGAKGCQSFLQGSKKRKIFLPRGSIFGEQKHFFEVTWSDVLMIRSRHSPSLFGWPAPLVDPLESLCMHITHIVHIECEFKYYLCRRCPSIPTRLRSPAGCGA